MANVEEPIGHRSSAWCGYAFDEPDDLIDFRRHLWQLDLSGDHREKLREVKGRHHWANWQWRELDDYCVARSIPYWEHIRPTPDYVYSWSSQSLRFEDGDVLVKLSPDPEDWLLLHSHVLGSVSPIMHAALKDEWSRNTVNVVHPITKREYQLYILCLQYDPTIGALFLQPESSPFETTQVDRGIRKSCLEILCRTKDALLSPPEEDHDHDCRCESNRARSIAHFKMFFSVMYGFPFDIEEILYCGTTPDFDALYDVIAWADFYLCLPSIADTLKGAIDYSQAPWNLLAEGRNSSVKELSRIAQALRYDELLLECVRHQLTIPSNSADAQTSPHERLHLEEDELDALLKADGSVEWDLKPEAVVEEVRRQLEGDLLPQVGFYVGSWNMEEEYWEEHYKSAQITHHSALETEIRDMPQTPMEMQASVLAGGIFREWCNLHTTGGYVVKRGESMASDYCDEKGYYIEGSFISMCLELQTAKDFSNPSSLISETVAADYACLFSNGGILEKVAFAKAIRASLDDLVFKAAYYVDGKLSAYTRCHADSSDLDRKLSFERQSRCNSVEPRGRETFTYCPLFEKNVPWRNKPEWTLPEAPKYDSTPASWQFLQLLGIGRGQ